MPWRPGRPRLSRDSNREANFLQAAPPAAWREFWDTVRTVGIALVIALLIRQFVVETYQVKGTSMQPNLQNGERLLVNKFVYRFGQPHIGQIIVFQPPIPGDTVAFVKRVVALPGQTFWMKDGQVYVDGKLQVEPWEPPSWRTHFTGSEFINGMQTGECPLSGSVDAQPITVPPGHIWVLGDHRKVSEDSRCFGPVPISSIRGQVMLIWWPFSDLRTV